MNSIDLTKYISSDGNVFAVSNLPEEVIAVLLAKYSRATGGMREILRGMLTGDELAVEEGGGGATLDTANEKARVFHEKYVAGYGHSSVGEHAIIHMGVEGVSILAAKAIEDSRIGGSWTEKSTRYVSFDSQGFVTPPELKRDGLVGECGRYKITCARLIDSYQNLVREIIQKLRQIHPRPNDMKMAAYDAMVGARAFDLCRGLLPASTKTNLGMTINARAMELLLTKLYSHPALEMRELAVSLHRESKTVAPTLVKYAAPSVWRGDLRQPYPLPIPAHLSISAGQEYAAELHNQYMIIVKAQNGVSISPNLSQNQAQCRVVDSLLWESNGPSGAMTYGLNDQIVNDAIIDRSLANRTRHERAPRAFETIGLQLELILDYGCFRDLQRHRMVSWTNGPLTAELGFDVPEGLAELGIEYVEAYVAAMQNAEPAWRELREKVGGWAAQYVVPLGYNYHVLANTNLRELFHLVELRSGKGGHVGYRRIAQELHRQSAMHWPWAAKHMRCDHATYDFARE